ncbi:MAG: CoA transferase [Deltaproteobacteria bacterium]|nr:CoA transferase [Deltaproteobacteria bacterium]
MEDYFSYTEKLFNPAETADKPEALKGIRVLDFSHVIFGPIAARVLGEYGAEVIKLELPFFGDLWRPATYWGKYWKHSNPIWHNITKNKYFISVNLKLDKSKELIYKMAETADVIIENFAPGTAEAWKIGYSQISKINPKIIFLSCSTYGQYGPMRYFPGWDLLAQGASGVLSLNGYEDRFFKLPDYLGDFVPGNFASLAVLMAIYYRNKTGKGQYIDQAQSEALMRLLPNYTYHSITGGAIGRTGNTDPSMVPAAIMKAKDDKFLALACTTEDQFQSLLAVMDRKDLLADPRFTSNESRLIPEHAKELNQIVSNWVKTKNCDEIIDMAVTQSIPAAEVMDDYTLCHDEWRHQRGSVILFNDDMYGELAIAGPSAQLSATPSRTKWLARPLGYHNQIVLKKFLNLSDDEIKDLEKQKVIGTFDDRPGLKPPVYYNLAEDPIYNYGKEVSQ